MKGDRGAARRYVLAYVASLALHALLVLFFLALPLAFAVDVAREAVGPILLVTVSRLVPRPVHSVSPVRPVPVATAAPARPVSKPQPARPVPAPPRPRIAAQQHRPELSSRRADRAPAAPAGARYRRRDRHRAAPSGRRRSQRSSRPSWRRSRRWSFAP